MPEKQLTTFDRLAACFPDPEKAPPDSPLCQGGNLLPTTLLCAYSRGIFPWYSEGLPLLWWCPDPRCVLFPEEFHLPRSSQRKVRKFHITLDNAFKNVIAECAAIKRRNQTGTWITAEIEEAYIRLHKLGYAHSVEAWRDGRLAGGLYGIALGKAFFGESMFHRESEASRACLNGLVHLLHQKNFQIIDCQQETPHMLRMGAKLIARSEFLQKLTLALAYKDSPLALSKFCPWDIWRERWEFDGTVWQNLS